MANARQILRNLMFSLDGQVMSNAYNQFEVNVGRERLERLCFEDIGKFSDKGDWFANLKLTEGYGTLAEAKILAGLAEDEEESDFLLLLRSDTRNSPMASPGSIALFMVCKTFSAPLSKERGQIQKVSGEFEQGDGRQCNIGQLLYTSRAKVANPLTEADSPVTSAPINLGDFVAGFEFPVTVHCHGITGSGVVTVQVEILSDVDAAFATPIVQHTFPLLFTNEDPAPGGAVLAPAAQTAVLTTPAPGEDWWAVRFTIVDAHVSNDGEVEISAAANRLAV